MPLEHRGFAIHISCDGKEIPHYGMETVSEVQVSCWIPSEAGKEFVVHYTDIRKDMEKIVRVYCDGRYVYGYGSHAGRSHFIDSVRVSSAEVKPFTFSQVLTRDDDDDSQNDVNISDLGMIEVRIFRVASKSAELLPSTTNHVNEIGAVSELSKKGGLHQVSLGKSKPATSRGGVTFYMEGLETEPYASFLFRHRSAGILQAMRIMPRPPPSEEPTQPSAALSNKRTKSPNVADKIDKSRDKRRRVTPASGSEFEEDVKPNIVEEEDPRIKLLQENLKKMQDELNGLLTAKSGSTRVKAERAPSPICVGDASGEIIDLTED